MSISSFCLEQREKEKAALKSILAYSITGSTVLHLVLAFGFALLPKEPSLADDPIEIVVLDAPEPEVEKPEFEQPKPTPQTVVTPTPEKAIPLPKPEPIPTPNPEPIPTPKPISTPKLNIPPTKVETVKPLESPVEPKEINEPIKTPSRRVPNTSGETLPPPKMAESVKEDLQKPNTPQPLQTPLASARDFKDQLAETQSVEKETTTEETPQLPGGLTANQQPLVDNSRVRSQPLESSVAENREFRDTANATLRDRLAATDNSTTGVNPSNDESLINPGAPGEVTTNRENSANKPTVNSQPLQTSPNRNREFRDNFANSNNSPTTSNPGTDISAATTGVPGQVNANRQIPNNKPVRGSQPLQTATNNRGFRDSFTNNNSSPSGVTSNNNSPTIPGTSSVAVNQPPARRNGQERGNREGDRTAARRSGRGGGLRCVSECTPDYPSDVENLEGRPVVQFVVEADGSTANPQLAESSGNSKLDQAAVEAVRKMRFAPSDEGSRTVKLAINFATRGSDFERQARERREENERQRRERERQRQGNLDTEN